MKYALILCASLVCHSAFAYNCTQYATRAIHQEKAAALLSCGYSGPRWTAAFAGHLAWCSSVPLGVAAGEDLARQQGLETCLQSPAMSSNCNVYAFRAVKEYKASLALGCGFSGARWQNNPLGHKMWCSVVSPSVAFAEDQARRNELEVCATN